MPMGLIDTSAKPAVKSRNTKKRTTTNKKNKSKIATWRKKVLDQMTVLPGTKSLCKTDRQTNTAEQVTNQRVLYKNLINNVLTIVDATTDILPSGLKPNLRLRNTLDVKGWKITLGLYNENDWPLMFHYAIICPLENEDENLAIDFFRDHDVNSDLNFSTGLTGAAMNNLPINRDKHAVLLHKKNFIPRSPGSGTWASGAWQNVNYRRMEFYVPFNRLVTYKDATDALPFKKIYAVYWTSDPTVPSGSPEVEGGLRFAHDVICYYKDVF